LLYNRKSSKKKHTGIALISTLAIMVIMVMIMVSMTFILTNSSFMTGRYIDNNVAMQVAEAGVAYAMSQVNYNPDWCGDLDDEDGSGNKYAKVNLPEVGGTFYITFNPSKDYCSYNNLRKAIDSARSVKPYGKIPPYTAEVIVKGEANNKVKYIRAVMVRGDFMDSNVSAEGPYFIKNATGYDDIGISDDTKGMICSNSSENPSVKIPTVIPVDLHGGKVVTCGIAEVENFEPNTLEILNNSSKQEFGKIPVSKIVNQRPRRTEVITEINPGKYSVARTENTDGTYSYAMKYNGSSYDCSEWAEFDEEGNLIIKKSLYINENGTTPLTIEFEYSNKIYELTGIRDCDGEMEVRPLLVKVLGISPAYGRGGETLGQTDGGGFSTPTARPNIPTPTPRPITPTPRSHTPTPRSHTPTPDPNGDPYGLISRTPTINHTLPTATPEPGGTGVPPTATPMGASSDVAPKIIFDVRGGTYRTIYSNADLDLRGRVNGIGAIVTTGKTSIIGDKASLMLLSGKDVVLHVDPYNNFESSGLIYSDDDIYVIETESRHAGLPPAIANFYDPNTSIDMSLVKEGDWIFGGNIVAHNGNSNDINPYNPSDRSCAYFDIPKKRIAFGRYINYINMDVIEGYEFPVKLVSWQEIK